MRLKRFVIGCSLAGLAVLVAPGGIIPSQQVTLSIGTATGNDTLYVGLPGAVVFSVDNPDTCITSIYWWCEWQMTNGISLSHIGASSNPEWSPAALQSFDTLTATFFADLLSPETTLVTVHDLDRMEWVGSGELFRVHVTPRRTGDVDFENQFVAGPPTWQTAVTPCGGTPFIPDTETPTISLVPCSMGNLVGGDVDYDREVNAVDLVYLINTVYKAGPLPVIPNLGDANCDFEVDATDIIVLVNYVFRGGPSPCDPCLTVSQNDPPETYIMFDTLEIIDPNYYSPRIVRPRTRYSLPEPTASYPGITIEWYATDSLDHPATQPVFNFNWILFGPFADQSSAAPDSGKLLLTNDSANTPELEWTTDTSHTFNDLREGWYVFSIVSRDDSLGVDESPSIVRFPVVEPSFHKPFLLLDATNWRNGQLLNAGGYNFRDPRSDSLLPDTVMELYTSLFENHGYAFNRDADTWHRWMGDSSCYDCYRALPDRDVLSQYKALVVYDEDMQLPLDEDNYVVEYESMIGDYLDVGGRALLIGRNVFCGSIQNWSAYDPPTTVQFPPSEWPGKHFGVLDMTLPGAVYEAQYVQPPDWPPSSLTFSAAIPLYPSIPILYVDTLRTLKLTQLPIPGLPDRNMDGAEDWLWVPDVNTVEVDTLRGAIGLYTFQAADSASSSMHGSYCGTRYVYYDTLLNQHTYRSALLTFPLSTMRQDSSLHLMVGSLLDFLLNDSIPEPTFPSTAAFKWEVRR